MTFYDDDRRWAEDYCRTLSLTLGLIFVFDFRKESKCRLINIDCRGTFERSYFSHFFCLIVASSSTMLTIVSFIYHALLMRCLSCSSQRFGRISFRITAIRFWFSPVKTFISVHFREERTDQAGSNTLIVRIKNSSFESLPYIVSSIKRDAAKSGTREDPLIPESGQSQSHITDGIQRNVLESMTMCAQLKPWDLFSPKIIKEDCSHELTSAQEVCQS